MKTGPSLRLGIFLWALLFQLFAQGAAFSQSVLNYQGRVISGGTAFNGTGQFKFAIVSSDGATFYWKNDGTNDSATPTSVVPLTVKKGIFGVRLGDASLSNMAAIPSGVLSNSSIVLRTWFNDGVKGFQQLSPDISVTRPGVVADSSLEPQVSLDLVSQFSPKFASNSANDWASWLTENQVICPVEFTVEFYIDGSLKAAGSWGGQDAVGDSTNLFRIGVTADTLGTNVKKCRLPYTYQVDSAQLVGKKVKWRIFNAYGEKFSVEVIAK